MTSRTILYAALFASLALNVFVAGALVGGRLGDRGPARPELRPRSPVAAAVRGLSPEHQAAWRRQMPDFARANGPRIREARRIAREAMLGFGAEPFDREAALAELKRARALEHESRVAMDRQLVSFAATLPQAERARFGEALARAPLGPGLRRGDAGERGRPGLADR